MGLFGRTRAAAKERRVARRFRVDCEAMLIMPSGERPGRLHDLSEDGARFLTADPPGVGGSAILEWGRHEAYCHVIWTQDGGCGLRFDTPVPRHIVEATADVSIASDNSVPGPAVVRGKFGQRRPIC